MSLFQCDKCGCLENTALTGCSHCSYSMNEDYKKKDHNSNTWKALDSYKKVLGLDPDQEFGKYCSACCPTWFTDKGEYGIGPIPDEKRSNADRYDVVGMWHGAFDRMFLPKGQFHTNREGNLAHNVTKKTDMSQYRLEKEEGT